ncbi:hypothetical protein C8F01DRAFT_1250231 [Mycena amicta]|nr:hypothetical protein C8F01DRAFT_1250231 [Mycena amicta]
MGEVMGSRLAEWVHLWLDDILGNTPPPSCSMRADSEIAARIFLIFPFLPMSSALQRRRALMHIPCSSRWVKARRSQERSWAFGLNSGRTGYSRVRDPTDLALRPKPLPNNPPAYPFHRLSSSPPCDQLPPAALPCTSLEHDDGALHLLGSGCRPLPSTYSPPSLHDFGRPQHQPRLDSLKYVPLPESCQAHLTRRPQTSGSCMPASVRVLRSPPNAVLTRLGGRYAKRKRAGGLDVLALESVRCFSLRSFFVWIDNTPVVTTPWLSLRPGPGYHSIPLPDPTPVGAPVCVGDDGIAPVCILVTSGRNYVYAVFVSLRPSCNA